MSAKASPMAYSPGKNFGEHHCRMFDMEDDDSCKEYSELRTKSNDAGSGIKIERVKEIIKSETETRVSKEGRTEEKKDHYLLYVEWWQAKPIAKGDADEAPEWSSEKPAVALVPSGGGGN